MKLLSFFGISRAIRFSKALPYLSRVCPDKQSNNRSVYLSFARTFCSKNELTVAGETEWNSSSTVTQTPCWHLPMQNVPASSTSSERWLLLQMAFVTLGRKAESRHMGLVFRRQQALRQFRQPHGRRVAGAGRQRASRQQQGRQGGGSGEPGHDVMMPVSQAKGNVLTVSRRAACYRCRVPASLRPGRRAPENGQKKARRHEACGRTVGGMAEGYRSRTYRRRLSLPPVLKTGRHTGDDTPPHDSHICDTKPGGKQVRPAARRRGRAA